VISLANTRESNNSQNIYVIVPWIIYITSREIPYGTTVGTSSVPVPFTIASGVWDGPRSAVQHQTFSALNMDELKLNTLVVVPVPKLGEATYSSIYAST
jgi:hypothetical protein